MELTEEDYKWKGLSHYEEVRKILNKNVYTVPWRNKYSSKRISGPCIDTCKKTMPKNAEDYYNRAGDYCNKMTKENMERIANMWRNSCNEEKIPLSVFYDGVVCHTIIETFNGYKKENTILNLLRGSGFTVSYDEYDDSMCGIDMTVQKGNKTYFIQVKTVSYLFGHAYDCIADRKKIFTEYLPNQKKKYGDNIPYYWIFYDKDSDKWIWNPFTNSFKWDISMILDSQSPTCKLKDEFVKYFKNNEFKKEI